MSKQTDFHAPDSRIENDYLILGIQNFSTDVKDRRYNTNNELMGSGMIWV